MRSKNTYIFYYSLATQFYRYADIRRRPSPIINQGDHQKDRRVRYQGLRQQSVVQARRKPAEVEHATARQRADEE